MHATSSVPRPGWRDVAGALLLCVVIVSISLGLGALRPHTAATMFGSAAAAAGGTLAMVLYLVRWTPYPRWGFLGAAVLLAFAVMLSPLVMRDPAPWSEEVRRMLWMYPCFFMVMAWVNPGGKPAWCAPEAPRSGWLLIATAALLTVILWGATFIARLM
jgi:hypothetical protein